MWNPVYSIVEFECATVSTLLWNSGVPLFQVVHIICQCTLADLLCDEILWYAVRLELQLQLGLQLTVTGSLS